MFRYKAPPRCVYAVLTSELWAASVCSCTVRRCSNTSRIAELHTIKNDPACEFSYKDEAHIFTRFPEGVPYVEVRSRYCSKDYCKDFEELKQNEES